MKLPSSKTRQEVGNLIQDFNQQGALEFISEQDKLVIDIIENYEQCGKENDDSLVYWRAQHAMYQYIVDQINREFKYVARDYVTGTPHSHRAGSVYFGMLIREESEIRRGQSWDVATDMLSSAVTCWDGMKMISRGREAREYNKMIKNGNYEGILDVISAQKAKDEGKLATKVPEYWEIKSKFYDFLQADIKQRMETLMESKVPMETGAAEKSVVEVVECRKGVQIPNMNRFFKPLLKWEELTAMIQYPQDYDWEEVMKLPSSKTRQEV